MATLKGSQSASSGSILTVWLLKRHLEGLIPPACTAATCHTRPTSFEGGGSSEFSFTRFLHTNSHHRPIANSVDLPVKN